MTTSRSPAARSVAYAEADPVYRVSTLLPVGRTDGTDLRNPVIDEARRLARPKGSPVLDVWHTGVDQNGAPYEVTGFVMRADPTALHYDTPVE